MKLRLKKLNEQVVVITGASSGIGLVTARMAAQRGARLVLAARSREALARLTDEICGSGGRCVYVVADVGHQEAVREIGKAAQEAFGAIDTWVNNAGVSIYGKSWEMPVEDMRRLFDTNFWGVVFGSLEAIRHLRGHGGALINVGSVVSDQALPMQALYCASKHAIKGFTDALRMELETEGAPISVTLVKPGSIDTPYTRHAKNYMESDPTYPPPVYAPETVARAILHCAETPQRDVFVGAGGKGIAALGNLAPRLVDRLGPMFSRSQKSRQRTRSPEQNAFDKPSEDLEERGDYEGHVSESSLYTQAALHPILAGAAALVGVGLAAAVWGVVQHGAEEDIRTKVRRQLASLR